MVKQSSGRIGRPPLVSNREDEIIERAAEMIAERGFKSVTIKDLAASLNISKGAIYHYFPEKDGIADTIINKTLEGLEENVGKAVSDTEDPENKLRIFMDTHAAYFEAHYWSFLAMLMGFSGIAMPAHREQAVATRDRYEEMLRTIIRDGIREGRFSDCDPAAAARLVLSMLNWMVRWFKPGGRKSAVDFARGYADVVLNGLKPGE